MPHPPPAFIQELEANLYASLLSLGRPPHGETYDGPDLKWAYSGTRLSNYVFAANFARSVDLDERIAAHLGLALLGGHFVPISWLVGPSSKPAHLGEALQRNGFVRRPDWFGMARDLRQPLVPPPIPEGFSIETVQTRSQLMVWSQVLSASMQLASGIGRTQIFPTFDGLGLTAESPWRFYIGRLDSHGAAMYDTVATCATFTIGSTVGFYWVNNIPEAQQSGVTAALVGTLLQRLCTDRRGSAVTHTTSRFQTTSEQEAEIEFYENLGFALVCSFGDYDYHRRRKG